MFPGKYAPYDEGIKEDVFIRNSSGGVLVGQVLCQIPVIANIDELTVCIKYSHVH